MFICCKIKPISYYIYTYTHKHTYTHIHMYVCIYSHFVAQYIPLLFTNNRASLNIYNSRYMQAKIHSRLPCCHFDVYYQKNIFLVLFPMFTTWRLPVISYLSRKMYMSEIFLSVYLFTNAINYCRKLQNDIIKICRYLLSIQTLCS